MSYDVMLMFATKVKDKQKKAKEKSHSFIPCAQLRGRRLRNTFEGRMTGTTMSGTYRGRVLKY
jgi:hypothetical protein